MFTIGCIICHDFQKAVLAVLITKMHEYYDYQHLANLLVIGSFGS